MLINGKQNGKKKLSSDYYFELLFLVRIPEKFTYTFLLSSDQVSSCIVHGGFSISDDDTLCTSTKISNSIHALCIRASFFTACEINWLGYSSGRLFWRFKLPAVASIVLMMKKKRKQVIQLLYHTPFDRKLPEQVMTHKWETTGDL